MTPTAESATQRPRVEGDREQEIFDATLVVLGELGYDRLTMDAVAARAKASKATLYRRWSTKVSLVIEALQSVKGASEIPDTGSLRGDLMGVSCGMGGLMDQQTVATFASVLTAITRDADFAHAFRREVVEPKIARSRQIWERARERGEVRQDADLSLLETALAGVVLHCVFVMGERPDEDLITRGIDHIILPAASRDPASLPTTPKED